MRTCTTALAALLLCISTAGAGVMIDDFEVGPFNEGTSPDTVAVNSALSHDSIGQTGLDANHVLGGQRYIDLTWTFGNVGQATAKVYLSLANDDLRYNNETGIRSILVVDYGRNPDGTLNPLNADLLSGGQNALGMYALVDAPDHPMDVQLEVTDGDGNSASAYAVVTNTTWAWTTFSYANYAGLDLGDVDRIRLILSSSAPVTGLDANIDCIQTIPEPTVTALMVVGALGVVSRRRRRLAAA